MTIKGTEGKAERTKGARTESEEWAGPEVRTGEAAAAAAGGRRGQGAGRPATAQGCTTRAPRHE